MCVSICVEKDPAKAKTFLTNYTNMTAQSTLDAWKRLGEFMIVKYNDGVVKRMKDGKFERNSIGQPAGVVRPGYPKEFLDPIEGGAGRRRAFSFDGKVDMYPHRPVQPENPDRFNGSSEWYPTAGHF